MKKGISLITLIITIVVIIILAAAVILTLGQNNPIQNAKVGTVAQTKDSIESSVIMYTSSIKANTLGNLTTKEILIDDENYKIIDGATATITVDGVEKTLYKIDVSRAKEKLNIEVNQESTNSWYIDEYGKIYLIYTTEESIPSYLKENGEVVQNVSSFLTYAGSVTEAPEVPETPSEKEKVKYLASDIASMTSEAEKQSVIGKSVTLTSTNGWDNWKVFSSDGTNIMLIAGDYVPVSYLPSGNGFGIGSYNTQYCVNSTTSRADLLSKLTTASTFNGFKDSAGKVITARIPTIEDFALSYNAVEHAGQTYTDSIYSSGYPIIQKVYYKDNGVNGGYNVSSDVNGITSNDNVPSNAYLTNYGIPQRETNYGKLWVIEDKTKACGYWLDSASSYSRDYVFYVDSKGRVDYHSYSAVNRGLRPVVILDSSVGLVQNIDGSNITYTLE